MTLHQWISAQCEAYGVSRREIMVKLQEASGVSITTLGSLDRGAKLTRVDKAQALSKATNYEVTTDDLT